MSNAPFFVNTEDGFVTDVIEGLSSQNTLWAIVLVFEVLRFIFN